MRKEISLICARYRVVSDVQVDRKHIAVSIVSHGQAHLIANLLADLNRYCATQIEVLLTLNIPEELPFDVLQYKFPIRIIQNIRPKGFGANHNAAFRVSECQYFCVTNPDIRLSDDVLRKLELVFRKDSGVGVVAPLVRNPSGAVEDSARRFPRMMTPCLRALGRSVRSDYPITVTRFEPDWVAGMFMLIPAAVYAAVGGFDERYFLYYEDVDLCARLRLAGYRVIVEPQAVVVHAARRDSRRKMKYLRWHIRSALRFFVSPIYRRVMAEITSRKDGHESR